MKKLLSFLLACALLCMLPGCGASPDSLQMNLFQGYGTHKKLIHLNASNEKNRERIEAFAQALADAKPLEKDFSMFAYYPDFRVEISGKALVPEGGDAEGDAPGFTLSDVPVGDGPAITAIVDINGDFVEFYFPDSDAAQGGAIYRSGMTAAEFKKLVHQA